MADPADMTDDALGDRLRALRNAPKYEPAAREHPLQWFKGYPVLTFREHTLLNAGTGIKKVAADIVIRTSLDRGEAEHIANFWWKQGYHYPLLTGDELRAIESRRKIGAIKSVRERHSLSLVDAKNMVEWWMAEQDKARKRGFDIPCLIMENG